MTISIGAEAVAYGPRRHRLLRRGGPGRVAGLQYILLYHILLYHIELYYVMLYYAVVYIYIYIYIYIMPP